MRKIYLLLGILLVIGFASSAGATFIHCQDCEYEYYQNRVTLGETLGDDGWINDSDKPIKYSHALPGNFSIPPDVVDWATLSILASFVSGHDDPVTIQETVDITNTSTLRTGLFIFSLSSFDLDFKLWNAGDSFDVTIDPNDSVFGGIQLWSSVLKLCYTDNGDPISPVSEPASMLLLGTGLIGLGLISRKKLIR